MKILLIALVLAFPFVGVFDFALFANERHQTEIPLVINEFMASNSSCIRDPQGQYDDWIEIYNTGAVAVDIADMYLTDDLNTPAMWRVPDNNPSVTTVPSQGYLLIWADNDTTDAGLHANFKLGAAADEIGLFDSDCSTLIDSIAFPDQTADISYGRYPDANDNWRFFALPTPGAQNNGAYLGEVAETQFSHNHGFYDTPFSVTLATETEGAVIYYTLDGSEPYDIWGRFRSGTVYTGPIPIGTTTCLRAKAIKPGWKPSVICTQTYIFLGDVTRQPAHPAGFPANWAHTGVGDYEMDPEVVNHPRYRDTIKDALKSVPTLSLVMDVDDWFKSGGQGIYVQGEMSERAVSAELLLPDGKPGFQINCAVMIVGGSSPNRWKMDKLSMRLKFTGEYGPTKLRFPLFGDDATDEFDTVVVDASMNNTWAYGGGVIVNRDGLQLTQRDTAQYTRDQFVSDIQKTRWAAMPRRESTCTSISMVSTGACTGFMSDRMSTSLLPTLAERMMITTSSNTPPVQSSAALEQTTTKCSILPMPTWSQIRNTS